MGMTSHVEGFKPPDDKWKQMKAIYDSCIGADVGVPEVVQRYFNHEKPDPAGVAVDLGDIQGCVQQLESDDPKYGFEIHLDKLPKDVKVLRFYNSY